MSESGSRARAARLSWMVLYGGPFVVVESIL